jgi:hypothetical protein
MPDVIAADETENGVSVAMRDIVAPNRDWSCDPRGVRPFAAHGDNLCMLHW